MPHPRYVPEGTRFHPRYVVWELTMRCDHACSHCGSRAVRPRPNELDRDELLDVADALIDLGAGEVTLIGGEAYLHPAFLHVAERLATGGVRVTVQTGGRGITKTLAERCRDAGIESIGVSIDGPADVHDVLRNSPGSHAAAMRALAHARDAGLSTGSNCQVNQLNHDRLREHAASLIDTGVLAWRAQLTTAMGRAADRPDWLLQPWQVLAVIDTLAELQLEAVARAQAQGLPPERILDIQLGNNLGYYGPHETMLRSRPGTEATWYKGCGAGQYVMGIESDGTIKGCPSLPTAPYTGGNVRDRSLKELWDTPELAFTRTPRTDELWGFCRTCTYAEICQAGCSFHTHSTFGRRGNNPHCYHRARTLKALGKRERIVQVTRAPGQPYDFGRFEIVEEPWPGQGSTP